MEKEEVEYRGYWIKARVKPSFGGGYVVEGSISPQAPDAVARLEPMLSVGEERLFPTEQEASAYYIDSAKAWIDKLIDKRRPAN